MRSRVVLVAAAGVLVCLAAVLALRNVEVRVDEQRFAAAGISALAGAVLAVVAARRRPWSSGRPAAAHGSAA